MTKARTCERHGVAWILSTVCPLCSPQTTNTPVDDFQRLLTEVRQHPCSPTTPPLDVLRKVVSAFMQYGRQYGPLERLFSIQGFMPHGHCYLWDPWLIWLHAISDTIIFGAYTAIPIMLVQIVRKRRDLPFHWMFLCFGAFIIACGWTHAMEIVNLWLPYYWLAGFIKVITAIASVSTAAILYKALPLAVSYPRPDKIQELNTNLSRRMREVTLQNKIFEYLQGCLSLEEAFDVIHHMSGELFLKRSGALCMINPSRDIAIVQRRWGEFEHAETFLLEDCRALRYGRLYSPDSGLKCKHVTSEGISYCLPLVAHGEAVGIVHLNCPDCDAYTDEEKAFLVIIGEQLALFLANLKMRETLRRQSTRDQLTELYNRRYMEETLAREISRATRVNSTIGVMMIDVDYFKKFNDEYGHEAGDSILKQVGKLMTDSFRASDVVCRYGGEEFLVMMPDASIEDSASKADKFREAIKRVTVVKNGTSIGPVTVSIGVAQFPSHGNTPEALVRAADNALYRAKKEGRDRVYLFE